MNTIDKMNNKEVFLEVLSWVEDHLYCVFGVPILNNNSLNEQWPDDTIDKSQKTGLITVRIAELFEEGFYRVLSSKGVDIRRAANEKGDFIIDGKPWEMKTTQGDKMQGATHSSSKDSRYIMIKYKLDYDKKLSENNSGLFVDYGVWLSEEIQNEWWSGQATNNNSRTVLNVPYDKYDSIVSVIGEVKVNRKYCKFINESIVTV